MEEQARRTGAKRMVALALATLATGALMYLDRGPVVQAQPEPAPVQIAERVTAASKPAAYTAKHTGVPCADLYEYPTDAVCESYAAEYPQSLR